MARIDNLTNFLTDVADAIRDKTGSSDTISAEDFDTAIENIPSGGGDDWSDIGYSSTPQYITNVHTYSKQVYDNWDADNPTKFIGNTNLVVCPLVDTSKLSSPKQMFSGCNKLKQVPALNIKCNSDGLYYFFYNCSSLEYVDLSNFDTTNSTTMYDFFFGCSSIKTIDLSTLDTSNLTSLDSAFRSCSSLTTINFGNNFDTSKVTNMDYTFYSTNKLDDNTLNQILLLCANSKVSAGNKNTNYLGITDNTLKAKIPTLSNYQAFLDAGWTIS